MPWGIWVLYTGLYIAKGIVISLEITDEETHRDGPARARARSVAKVPFDKKQKVSGPPNIGGVPNQHHFQVVCLSRVMW